MDKVSERFHKIMTAVLEAQRRHPRFSRERPVDIIVWEDSGYYFKDVPQLLGLANSVGELAQNLLKYKEHLLRECEGTHSTEHIFAKDSWEDTVIKGYAERSAWICFGDIASKLYQLETRESVESRKWLDRWKA